MGLEIHCDHVQQVSEFIILSHHHLGIVATSKAYSVVH